MDKPNLGGGGGGEARFSHRRFQLSKFCIYDHKISQGYSIMTDNLKRAGIFRKSVYFLFYGVRS